MRPRTDRDSGRSYMRPEGEEILQNHYGVLRNYLASSLRDAQGNIKPNRARDKLLRLSSTQFMELSTDVFDELVRREDDRTQRVLNVPPFLPPRNNFHPKRNQARQKLSTLPVERFKQLATDVFYELERRIPRLGGDHSRSMSMSSNASRGMPGPPAGAFRGPGIPYGGPPSDDGLSRPVQKTPQSNTIVPNKGTMIEDDDEDDDEDAFGLDKVMTGLSARGESTGKVEDKEKIEAQETEISELKQRIEVLEEQLGASDELQDHVHDLESKLKQKDDELAQVKPNLDESQEKHRHLQAQLDQRLADAQRLHTNLQRELDQLRQDKSQDEQAIRNLRMQLDQHRDGPADNAEQTLQVSQLQDQLAQQDRVINEVRNEAMTYLQEMRELSRQNDRAIEQEDKLSSEVSNLETEVREWKRRYASAKAQNKSLRASTNGLGLSTGFATESLLQREGVLSSNGLVKDIDMTHFQLAIDELLKVARQLDTDRMLNGVKNVVVCVQAITSNVGTDGYPTPSTSPSSPSSQSDQPESVTRLRARVMGTANSLITATKQHAAASGLSPVVLLDAAASNLAASVVALAKAVGIRASPQSELMDDQAINMDSYYDGEESDHHVSTQKTRDLAPPTLHPPGSTPPLLDANGAQKSPSTPLGFAFGRSDSTKKGANNGGWFGGWGRKVSDEESASSAYSTDAGPHGADVDDYEAYR